MSKKKARKAKVTRQSLAKKIDKALAALAKLQATHEQVVGIANARIQELRDALAALPADPPAAP